MPADDSAAVLVARFLQVNGYNETLAAFVREAGLPADAGNSAPGSLTIEAVLREKKMFDIAARSEKTGVEDEANRWRVPAPSVPTVVPLPTSSNILQASLERARLTETSDVQQLILATTADRQLNLVRVDGPWLVRSLTNVQDSPILSYTVIAQRFILCTSMSGRLVAFDLWTNQIVAERRDHSKYAVKVATYETRTGETVVATAGWDGRVFIYNMKFTDVGLPALDPPVGTIELATNPEDLILITDPRTDKPFLVLTRRDSTFLHYYALCVQKLTQAIGSQPTVLRLDGKQNLTPHSGAWVAFTPSAIAVCPTDPRLVAIATSATPHMRLLVARLLFPNIGSASRTSMADQMHASEASRLCDREGVHQSAIDQVKAELAQRNREEAAIVVHCNVFAPQTPYSTPALTWRPDGTGVFVNSDDGVIRGVQAVSGKIITSLGGHDVDSKIRCLWSGLISDDSTNGNGDQQELLVSGGFDQKLVIWRAAVPTP